jgi:hypothetical protein
MSTRQLMESEETCRADWWSSSVDTLGPRPLHLQQKIFQHTERAILAISGLGYDHVVLFLTLIICNLIVFH